MLTLAALAHFDLPRLPQNLRAQDTLAHFGPEGLAWVVTGERPLGFLDWNQALAHPQALALHLAQPLAPAPASAHGLADSLTKSADSPSPLHWRLYRGTELRGLVLGWDLELWARIDALALRAALRPLGEEHSQRLAGLPVGLYWADAQGTRCNRRTRLWLGSSFCPQPGPEASAKKRAGLMVRGRTGAGRWAVCWTLDPEPDRTAKAWHELPRTKQPNGEAGLFYWSRHE